MHRKVLVVLTGVLLAGCQFAGGVPERVEPVAVVAPRSAPSAAEEAIGARENPRVVAE